MNLGIKLNLNAIANHTFTETEVLTFSSISDLDNYAYIDTQFVRRIKITVTSTSKKLEIFTTSLLLPSHELDDNAIVNASTDGRYIVFKCSITDSSSDILLKWISLGLIEINQFGKTTMFAYRLNDEADHITKSLTFVTVLEGKFTAPVGIKTLELDVIDYNIDNAYNYVYIPKLKRYYYIDHPILTTKDYTRLVLKEDVLMSWKSLILSQNAYVTRYGDSTNVLLVDDRYPVTDECNITYTKPTTVTGASVVSFKYVMDVVNGKSKPNILCKTSSEILTFLGAETNVSAPSGSGLPDIEGTKAKVNKVYLLNINDYGGLVRACLLNNAPSSFIHNIMLLPFDLGDIFPYASMRNSNLLAGDKWLGTTGGIHWTDEVSVDDPLYPETNMSAMPYIVVADFMFNSNGGISISANYLDYAPFTQWEIYIPFVGWVALDPVAVIGMRIMIYFALDTDTGLSTCYIYNKTLQKVIWSGSCQLGMKLSLAVTNADELARQKQATSLNLIMGIVSSMASMGIGGYTANPVAMVGGIMGMANTVKDAVNSFNSMIERAQITYGSSDNALFSPKDIYIRKTTHAKLITSVEEEARYNHINGKPYKQYVVLSTLTTGKYIEVGDIHFNYGNENIYTEEVTEIVALLKNGVIL